jgi:hypothetical protein
MVAGVSCGQVAVGCAAVAQSRVASEIDGEGETRMKLWELGLAGLDLRLVFAKPHGEEGIFQPQQIRLRPEGMFIEWPEPPEGLEHLQVQWANCPFMPGVWRCECAVDERNPNGIEVTFERSAPRALRDWFLKADASLSRSPSDATLSTSKLYTAATVVSACGLFCGAAAMLLPIVVGSEAWVDLLAKVLLVVMVSSIAGFAGLRTLAGRAELRALRQDG